MYFGDGLLYRVLFLSKNVPFVSILGKMQI